MRVGLTGLQQRSLSQETIYDLKFLDEENKQITNGLQLLSGSGPPSSGDGMLPLDGINDPWRFWTAQVGWVLGAWAVTWTEGDMIPYVAVEDRADEFHSIAVFVGQGTSLAEIANTADPSTDGGYRSSSSTNDVSPGGGDATATLTAIGSGVAVLVQNNQSGGGLPPPDPDLDPTDALYLGDLIVGDQLVLSDVTTGSDGQFYLDLSNRDLYGPRTAGAWTKISTLPPPE